MTRCKFYSLLTVGLLCGAAVGCKQTAVESPASPKIVLGSELTEEQKSKLLSAKDALFTKLSGRLMEAMSQSGPAGAIEVCQTEARQIADDIGRDQNVSIGRTGVRLRNSANQPPAWAMQLVADKVDSPVFAKLSNDQTVALLPIKLQPQCLMCHGPQDMISADVQEKLAKLYPQDQATGFAEGELRGWFWVESISE